MSVRSRYFSPFCAVFNLHEAQGCVPFNHTITYLHVRYQFSSILWLIGSSAGHEGRFSRDNFPLFSEGGHRGYFLYFRVLYYGCNKTQSSSELYAGLTYLNKKPKKDLRLNVWPQTTKSRHQFVPSPRWLALVSFSNAPRNNWIQKSGRLLLIAKQQVNRSM